MGITIKDVAQMAGVSVTTVSHVINNTRYVSDGLRARVQDAIRELDYHPNALARGLRGGESRTIGLIVPDNSNPFFAEVARDIEDVGFAKGYSVILCNSDGDIKKESAYIEILIAKKVDGVIFIASGSSHDHIQRLLRRDIPVVIADRDISSFPVDMVMVSNEQGGYEATKYLLALGHKKIGCITGPSELTPSADRVRGYRRAILEENIPIIDEYIVSGDFRFQSGSAAMECLLNLADPPTAVFICNDMMAIGALRTLRKAGLKVPEDLSIVGFDDIELASAVSPALTTIHQPIEEFANLTVKILLNRIHKKPAGKRRMVFETRLVIRDSCAAPAGQGT